MRPPPVERFRAARRDPDVAVLEGLHAVKHALRFGAEILEAHTADPAALRALTERLAPDVADEVARIAKPVDPDTFAALCPSPPSTGVVALARRPAVDAPGLLGGGGGEPVVLLERPTHHGNIGAAIRVAAAAGAAGVLTTGPHDPWHPGAIRGAAGLQFALPVSRVEALPATDRPIVVLDPEGDPLRRTGAGVPPGAVLVFGSEREGVSDPIRRRAQHRLRIPMAHGVSSLNLATSVAVALYLTSPAGGADADLA